MAVQTWIKLTKYESVQRLMPSTAHDFDFRCKTKFKVDIVKLLKISSANGHSFTLCEVERQT